MDNFSDFHTIKDLKFDIVKLQESLAEVLKIKASDKIEQGKKKFNKLNIKDKLLKFKNSKSHKDFVEN